MPYLLLVPKEQVKLNFQAVKEFHANSKQVIYEAYKWHLRLAAPQSHITRIGV